MESEPHDPVAVALQQLRSEALHAPGHLVRWVFRQLDFFFFHWFDPWVEKIPLEEEMATHSSILVWRITWTEEPGGLQSMGSQTFGAAEPISRGCPVSQLLYSTPTSTPAPQIV